MLIKLVDLIKIYLGNDNYVFGDFINLQKVFHIANHSNLLEKLEYHGFHGLNNDWLSFFLKNTSLYLYFL